MRQFICSILADDGQVKVVTVNAATLVEAATVAARDGGEVLSAVLGPPSTPPPSEPLPLAVPTTIDADESALYAKPADVAVPTNRLEVEAPLEAAPPTRTSIPPTPAPPRTEDLRHKALSVSSPALTPDSQQYVAIGLIKDDRHKTVSLVVETATGKPLVAHQLHLPDNVTQEDVVRSVEKGVSALARVNHPCVPRFMGYQSTPTGQWLLFEYVEGCPLDAWQGRDKHTDMDVVWWLYQMLQILDDLHRAGVIVGGLAPHHFLVSEQRLFLVHVGIMENLLPIAQLRSPKRLAYTAPEHRHSLLTSVSADLYSAGAVAWWLATGQAPPVDVRFSEAAVKEAILPVRPDVPEAALSVLSRLLQFNPSDRLQTAAEACMELAPCLPAEPASSGPGSFHPHVRFFGVSTISKFNSQAQAIEQAARPPEPPPPEEPKRIRPAPPPDSTMADVREALGDLHWHLFRKNPLVGWGVAVLFLLLVVLWRAWHL